MSAVYKSKLIIDRERQQRVYELLKRGLKLIENGDELPVEWAREFFPPERREYELIYHGKESEEKILADTMALPLQPVSTFGTNGIDWHNMLILGDNLQVMKTLLQMKERGELINADGTPGVRLIYIDPPFSTKRDFRGSQDQKAYQDKIAGAEFLEFLRKRLIFLRELLSRDGSIYVHLDWKKGHYLKVLMDEVFQEQHFRNEIVWYYTNKIPDTRKRLFTNSTDMILFYAKNSENIFNPLSEPREIPIKVSKMKKVDGKKIYEKDENGKGIYIERSERVVDNVWKIPLLHAQPEILGYPTQKPENLLKRIIEASSNNGDIVLDCFAGSGTTLATAEKLGRRWIGVDCGKLAIYTTQKRILRIAASPDLNNAKEKYQKSFRPFTLYNAGLYDFETLRQLPWNDWRFFALQLFECKDESHKIRGFQMDGKRQGSSVLVFNHFDKGTVSRETISDIHANIGKQVGERCFIIAPRGAFLFQEDYIELDAVRYYALRIPYSIINELHRREFSALTQPRDETAVNETVDSYGFDFIQPPIVELETKIKKDIVFIKIKKFESRARLRGEEKISKLDSLSMVMVDFEYNGKVFDLDRPFYADALKNNSWEVEFSLKDVVGNIMLVFLDIYGNESRMIIEKKRLVTKSKQPKRRSHK